jgi:hypothetical protein
MAVFIYLRDAGLEDLEYIARNKVSTIRKVYSSCKERVPASLAHKTRIVVIDNLSFVKDKFLRP